MDHAETETKPEDVSDQALMRGLDVSDCFTDRRRSAFRAAAADLFPAVGGNTQFGRRGVPAYWPAAQFVRSISERFRLALICYSIVRFA